MLARMLVVPALAKIAAGFYNDPERTLAELRAQLEVANPSPDEEGLLAVLDVLEDLEREDGLLSEMGEIFKKKRRKARKRREREGR